MRPFSLDATPRDAPAGATPTGARVVVRVNRGVDTATVTLTVTCSTGGVDAHLPRPSTKLEPTRTCDAPCRTRTDAERSGAGTRLGACEIGRMADFEVTCVIRRGTTHETITHVGGPGFGRLSTDDVIRAIQTRQHTFHTRDLRGRAYLRVLVRGTSEWLQTFADGRPTNDLLALPACR